MNASFGIDHPLLATHDIEALRDRLIAMGFNMTPIGRHPWGTSTSLGMFDGCLLEIMGIYDASLIDEVPAGEFRFGRHVYEHLQQREGVALTALHSTDSIADADKAARCGLALAGHLEFSREVTLPDGSVDHTKTTLALLPDPEFPRLSFFLCQQHRPELIYVPEWLQHPNTVNGICGVNVVASDDQKQALVARFEGLYQRLSGDANDERGGAMGEADEDAGGIRFQTANGELRVFSPEAFEQQVGPLAPALCGDTLPFIAGMDFSVEEGSVLRGYLDQAGVTARDTHGGLVLADPQLTANTTFRFIEQ